MNRLHAAHAVRVLLLVGVGVAWLGVGLALWPPSTWIDSRGIAAAGVALVVLAVWALVGAALVFLGRGRGWLVLAAGSVLPLLGLLAVTVLFGTLGGGSATWWAVLLTVGPIGSLVLACQRPVREWTTR